MNKTNSPETGKRIPRWRGIRHLRYDSSENLAILIEKEWDAIRPLPKLCPSLLTPSRNQLIILSRIILPLCGVNPFKCSDAVPRHISVSVTNPICREEPNLDRLVFPVRFGAVGITNCVERICFVSIYLDKTHRFTIKLYRNLVGIAAVVFDEQVSGLSARHFSVHFITHETQQAWVVRRDEKLFCWLVGWSGDAIKSMLGNEQIKATVNGTSLYFQKRGFSSLLRCSFASFLSNLIPPFKPPKCSNQPAANRGADDFGNAHAMPNGENSS
jgi:hypothetical protein